MIISGRQVAAARELLNITQRDLANFADVALNTITRFEAGAVVPHRATAQAIKLALEQRGIIFTNGDRPSVTLDPSKAVIPTQ